LPCHLQPVLPNFCWLDLTSQTFISCQFKVCLRSLKSSLLNYRAVFQCVEIDPLFQFGNKLAGQIGGIYAVGLIVYFVNFWASFSRKK
jgi:hypothetical protein